MPGGNSCCLTSLHDNEQSHQHPCVLVFVSKMGRIILSIKVKHCPKSILSVMKFGAYTMQGVTVYFVLFYFEFLREDLTL